MDRRQRDPAQVGRFSRTLLKTYYLQEQGEPQHHLVNEPFDYERVKL
jgi:hypothetical protein